VQVQVIPVGDDYLHYAHEVENILFKEGIRVEVDGRGEKLGKKIREAQLQQIPYMLIVGQKEQEAQKVAVRHRRGGDLGTLDTLEFINRVKEEIAQKKQD
jgi:threonyl-tRNA synthetase